MTGPSGQASADCRSGRAPSGAQHNWTNRLPDPAADKASSLRTRHPCDSFLQAHELDGVAVPPTLERRMGIAGHHQQPCLGIIPAEGPQSGGIKVARGPFALQTEELARQVAVETLDSLEALCQTPLAHTPDAAQPDHGPPPPLLFNQVESESAFDQTQAEWRLVKPNARLLAFENNRNWGGVEAGRADATILRRASACCRADHQSAAALAGNRRIAQRRDCPAGCQSATLRAGGLRYRRSPGFQPAGSPTSRRQSLANRGASGPSQRLRTVNPRLARSRPLTRR